MRSALPHGRSLPDAVWAARHRRILVLLWLHVPGLFLFALVRGQTLLHSLVEAALVAAFPIAVEALRHQRRASTIVASLGLLTCSAVLVHLSGGVIEAHFHYFVMVGVVTLYQDWMPFLLAAAYVVIQHGVSGVIAPDSVFNHRSAIEHPWTWAGIHGLFILAMSFAAIASWKVNEVLWKATAEREAQLSEAQEEAQHTLSLLSATLDSTADALLVVDFEGHISLYNQRFVEMWQIPEDVLASGDDNRALASVLNQLCDPEAFLTKVRELYAHPELQSFDTLAFRDGRQVERISKPQRIDGKTVGRVWSFRDVTDHKRLETELAHQAFHDSLTGLANLALFRDRVDHAVARNARHADRLAVLFLDLDNFKTVNDSLGHSAGDEILVAVADRLGHCVRESDTVARLGGDEFAVLLEDLSSVRDVTQLADRIIAVLQRPFGLGGREVFIGASIGIALDGAGLDSGQLFRNADIAMYTAKRQGKGRYDIFQPAMHLAAVERMELEADLRKALERRELTLEYQPVVNLATGGLTGVEALVRWIHPERGPVSPGTFIPLAEEAGLIGQLGRQVLTDACAQARWWQLQYPHCARLKLSVNLSPRQLQADDLVEEVREALASSGLPPAALVLEITEGAMMRDAEAAITKLYALKALGVSLAVDDFGTGYSSLSYLQRFPIDILKVDRAFVNDIDTKDEQASLAAAILSLASSLRLHAVAEGVETATQARALAALGCAYAQGYYFARPMPAAELVAILDRGFVPIA